MPNDNSTAHSASEYDTEILKTIPYYDRFHQETIRLVQTYKPQPNTWLDTGCGTGEMVQKCWNLFPETEFILSDPSASMLEKAEKKFSENSSHTTFLKPAATHELADQLTVRPDVITAIQAHHYLSAPERVKATEVCYQLLNTDGIFITFENISPMTETGINIGKKYWGEYQLDKGKSEEQVSSHLSRFGKEYFPITVEDHISLYKSCGFKVVEMFWYSYMQAGFYCIK
jgi:tRNA (cmo5U34)-methyltransferase